MNQTMTVSKLNRYVKLLLDEDKKLRSLMIEGEVSNFTKHYKTGHCYFSLKDEGASVKCVMFASDASALGFLPENGMSMILRGNVSLYERDGSYQFYCREMIPLGDGAIQLALEQLKERLSKEGLFDVKHKKTIKKFPSHIAVITSKTGAAYQDILNVVTRRFPHIHLTLLPVSVQGEGAAAGIISAVKALDKLKPDTAIIARGGGSKEDLWVFNNEELARAVFVCKTPIISAIGHEIDFTVLDFVADFRAPTPSAAAELAVPDLTELTEMLSGIRNTLGHKLERKYITDRQLIDFYLSKPMFTDRDSLLQPYGEQITNVKNRLTQLLENRLRNSTETFVAVAAKLEALNPLCVLTRGYSITVQNEKNISSIKEVSVGEPISVKVTDGTISANVTGLIKE